MFNVFRRVGSAHRLALVIAVLLVATSALARLEKEYQAEWCGAHGGTMEVVLPDGARADCVTNTHAIEFDFAHKWAESVGQCLLYAAETGKRPGIVLIEGPGDERYLNRLMRVIRANNLPIDVWEMQK